VTVVLSASALVAVSVGPASGATGDLSTYAGKGKAGLWVLSGAATQVALNQPHGLAYDNNTSGDPFAGDVFIADTGNCAIRYVNPKGKLHTLVNATKKHPCAAAVPGPASTSPLDQPHGITYDKVHKQLYIADAANGHVDDVDLSGATPTLSVCPNTAGGSTLLADPVAVAVHGATGDLYVSDDATDVIVHYSFPCSSASPDIVAGVLDSPGFNGDGNPCTSTLLDAPNGVAYDSSSGSIIISDTDNDEIRECVPGAPPVMAHLLGTPTVPGLTTDGSYPGGNVAINQPHGVKQDGSGALYFDELGNDLVRRFDSAGDLTTIAGGGAAKPPKPGSPAVPATSVHLGGPHGITFVPTSSTTADVLFSNTAVPPGGTTSVLRVRGVAVPL
jgi:hypothetical protein